jgi:hypothetical protein
LGATLAQSADANGRHRTGTNPETSHPRGAAFGYGRYRPSGPFAKTQSAARLIGVLDVLTPSQTGLLFDHMGVQIAL